MKKVNLHLGWLLVLSLGLLSCSDDRESVSVASEDIIESVYSSIVVEASTMYQVNSTVSGYISAIHFEVGDEVHMGDVIFQIRDVQGANSASNAQLAYLLAQKNYSGDQSALDDLKLQLDNAKFKRKNDSINYQRNLQLFEKSMISKVEMEQSELLYASSKNAYSALLNQRKRLERELKMSLEQARNNYNTNLARSNDAMISSNIDGKIYDITKEDGELVGMQESIAIVGSDDSFVLKMRIDEVDITKVQLGQKIIVSLEAYKNKVFEALVTRISPKMDARTQTFEIEGKFTKPPKSLYLGLTGEGNIVINERSNVLVIPLEYLSEDNWVETENGRTKVTIGARSLSHVEILSGLKKGELIYKPQ